MTKPTAMPTEQMYAELQQAYDHFNTELFGGELKPCLITLQRQKKTEGYFSAARFTNRDGEQVDEIAMNPAFFAVRGIKQCMQTLVHEQVHAWQEHFGEPGRGRYHNAEWSKRMVEIGLMPTDTGHPGGKTTGDRMSDYVIEGGPFDVAFSKLMTKKFVLSWLDRFPVGIKQLAETMQQLPEEVQIALTEQEVQDLSIQLVDPAPAKKSTVTYECPLCTMKVWGKPKLEIGCLKCKIQLDPKVT